MPRQSQFGARENTASSRQHASRLAVPSTTPEVCVEQHPGSTESEALISTSLEGPNQPSHAAPESAATAGEPAAKPNRLLTVHEVAELLRVPVSWVYSRTRKRTIDRLPGYRIGKYWRFSETEILAWVKRQREVKHAA